MSFISDLFVGVLTGYIALTNHLAADITSLFDNTTDSDSAVVEETPKESFLTQLPSRIASIPDVLLKSAAYQSAAVGDAVRPSTPTDTDPIDAIVNIFCTFETDRQIKTTTGTGFFIDQSGVIMTNAHVAQFLLLATTDDYGQAKCVVRSGNPASPKYMADLLYIPPAWVQENANLLNEAIPMGTGERDYALLYVNETVDGSSLPTSFPALSFSSEFLATRNQGASVVVSGYPASALLRGGATTDLIPRKANTSISKLYTFGSNRADVFSIKGSVVGAEGASGGPVVNEDGDVIGMIATRGNDDVDGPGSLSAITLSHVDSTITEETGFTLTSHLEGDLETRAQIYAEAISPFLLSILQEGSR